MRRLYDWPADVPYPWYRDPVIHMRVGYAVVFIAAVVWRIFFA